MAKFDQFTVSEKFDVGLNQGEAALVVLFEDGDDVASVMNQAQALVDNHIEDEIAGGGGSPTVPGAISYLNLLTREQVRDACRQYWTAQMTSLRNDKFAYANELREDVNTAQNNS